MELQTGTGGWILVLGARISNWGLELGLVLEAGIWNCRGLVLGLDFETTGCDLELGNGTDYWSWDLELVAATWQWDLELGVGIVRLIDRGLWPHPE